MYNFLRFYFPYKIDSTLDQRMIPENLNEDYPDNFSLI
jgi:hypothetical protein